MNDMPTQETLTQQVAIMENATTTILIVVSGILWAFVGHIITMILFT